MIDRDESELIAREQRNQRTEGARQTEPARWQNTRAANDAVSSVAFRTLVRTRATRYSSERNTP